MANITAYPPSLSASSLLPSWVSTSVLAALTVGAASLILASKLLLYPSHQKNIRSLGGFSILAAWPFFTRRYDFLWDNFKETGRKMFQFHVLHHRVVVLAGEEGRKAFFSDQSLHLGKGYELLMGAAPKLSDINVVTDGTDTDSDFIRRLLILLRKERINNLLPTLYDDVQRRMTDWGTEGTLNPFKEVYDLVFQMTIRLATCRELSEDKGSIVKLAGHYWDLERSATPFSLLLPWFPSPAKKLKTKATTALYTMLSDYVEMRRKAPYPSSDAIDILIAEGDSNETIVGCVLSIVFAGVVNTGMNVCWNLLYLGSNPEWKSKVAGEVQSLIANHTDTTSTEPLHKRLSTIPMSAWEEEMPALDTVIRETLRLIMTGTALRRNMVKDISIEGTVIRKGDFLAYSTADVHENADIYSDPSKFDPGRYAQGREEDKKETFGYLGWGVGRHPCAGMRIAKLEMKLVIALILAGYEYELVNASGDFPTALPRPDKNDIQQARPIGEPCYMKYRRIVE